MVLKQSVKLIYDSGKNALAHTHTCTRFGAASGVRILSIWMFIKGVFDRVMFIDFYSANDVFGKCVQRREQYARLVNNSQPSTNLAF